MPSNVPHTPPLPGAASPDEPPPFLGTWRRVYLAIALYLCGFIALLAFFTWGFHR